jgi:hypothetical protein
MYEMRDQHPEPARSAADPLHAARVRLWEAIFEQPYPLRSRTALPYLAAYLDWRRDQAAIARPPRTTSAA